jgi:hypothetical protein
MPRAVNETGATTAALSSRYSSAIELARAGDPASAAVAFESLLPDQPRVLGPDHPDPPRTRYDLGNARSAAGDPAGAARSFEQWLTERGAHPGTGANLTEARLAVRLHRERADDPAGAAADYERLLAEPTRLLGADHPVVETRAKLVSWRTKAGHPADVVDEYRTLRAEQNRTLGPDDEETLNTRGLIAESREKAGDPGRRPRGLHRAAARSGTGVRTRSEVPVGRPRRDRPPARCDR